MSTTRYVRRFAVHTITMRLSAFPRMFSYGGAVLTCVSRRRMTKPSRAILMVALTLDGDNPLLKKTFRQCTARKNSKAMERTAILLIRV
jgi:hypothetical protein